MNEFGLIDRLRAAMPAPGPGLALGIGDDAAVFDLPTGQQLVACTDTLNTGIHFPDDTDPAAIGHKSLAVNLSDLAAMGADPAWALLNLSLPDTCPDWLDAFAAGFAALAGPSGITLAGGDTTRGALSVTVTALGFVPAGQALTRDGARPGDRVVVSGTLGDAALALSRLGSDAPPAAAQRDRLDRPTPRLELGRRLRGLATACIDISDGLAADLGHILAASAVGAHLDATRLPASTALASLPFAQRLSLQATGGDDYELCFTLPAAHAAELDALAADAGVALTDIGEITPGDALEWSGPGGQPVRLDTAAGYDHFGGGGT
ncbi:thiamine-phosphate kinase [Marinihelvus fidelis]|uniref:Thiamine-monophosphate kinase n=1 Tax=Marinihelvus fidelis TaxID=2613842 RepID=A0A5N0TBN0_9GAMM|nr:thiamine-phosphate kinase [Marinihelvus fidelis]KAA9130749.1 thiamine-phosphate kinase [Marinihelvus fidelis]